MRTLVLAGLGHAPGKTSVAVVLAQRWKAAGRHVEYSRVVAPGLPVVEGQDPDAAFVRQALGPEGAAPAPGPSSPDVEIVELAGDAAESPATIAGNPGNKVLLVAGYRQGISGPTIVSAARGLGDGVIGAVVNGVPRRYLPIFLDGFALDGVPLLGVVPESRVLAGFTVSELAEHLGAEYLGAKGPGDEVVEHLMLGANITDTATTYFLPKEHMAVFCRVDRPDLQLAALNLSVRCLVLTGTGVPQASLMYRAEDLGVPVLRVLTDTLDTLDRLEGLVEKGRFRQAGKVAAMGELLGAHVDLQALDSAVGL